MASALTLLLYILVSVFLVSITSMIGIFTFLFKSKDIEKIGLYFVSFAVGALFGDVFIHLMPEAFRSGVNALIGVYIVAGILFSFIVEKFIHWRHCHLSESTHHHHSSFVYMNLLGDVVHNFIDGLIIAGSYFVNVAVGVATTIAVFVHEIPHEVGNFGVLIHGGFSRGKALLFNFLTALFAIAGALLGFFMARTETLFAFLVPFAAGNLIYIAGTDLIPQLHGDTCEENELRKSAWQLVAMLVGVGLMLAMLLLE